MALPVLGIQAHSARSTVVEAAQPLTHPSPNFGPRRDDARPDLIVLHYTAMQTAEAALERLCDPAAEVSCHYLISETGQLWQLVDEEMRAWHAGAGAWGAVTDVNSRSIGIELANTGRQPYSEPQMAVLERLLATIMGRWSIPPERVSGHSDMAPTRKQDPGPRFDWRRLARQGLSVWPEVEVTDDIRDPNFWTIERIEAFGATLREIGYDVPQDELPGTIFLKTFCDRFVPGKAGKIGPAGYAYAAAQDLARRFPVDRDDPNA